MTKTHGLSSKLFPDYTNLFMEGEKFETESDRHAETEGAHQESAVQRWRNASKRAGQDVIDRYWPNIIITILGVLILTPLAGVVMRSPRTIIIGIATGLTLIVWLAAYQIDRHLRMPPQKSEPVRSGTDAPISKEDVNEIKRQLADLYRHLKPPTEQITKKYPGLSIQGVLSLHAIQEKRRKYLFDFGRPDKDRFSIYFDPDNVLTLALVAANNEPYNVRVAPADIPLDQFAYVAFEVAVGDNSTSLRVFVNGKSAAMLDLPFKVDPGKLDPTGGVVGADLNGNNGARFDMAEVVLYTSTLTSDEIEKLLQYFSSKPRNKFAQFNGSQWMRQMGKGHGLQQDIPEAKPIFRDLDAQPTDEK